MVIEQAIYGSRDAGGYQFLARSPGFAAEWLPDAEQLCTAFGDRPAGAVCELAVFARPFMGDRVAVVQVADQGADDTGRPGAIAFRLLVLPATLYRDLHADPFLISDRLPPDWSQRGDIPALGWTFGPAPARTVADLRAVLDSDAETTQTLLGGAQILLDGGRVVIERQSPATALVRGLWMLLPSSTRGELWPATFAFSNIHGFHVLATPSATAPGLEHHTNAKNAGDYPEGRYEYALQYAIEDGDQASLDALLSRRSRGQMIRMGLVLLLLMVLIPPLILILPIGPQRLPREQKKADPPAAKQTEALRLPDARDLPSPTPTELADLHKGLTTLAGKLGVAPPTSPAVEELAAALVAVDQAVAGKLGEKRAMRDPGKLEAITPLRRRLMALGWKYEVPGYEDPRRNVSELLQGLEQRWAALGAMPKDE